MQCVLGTQTNFSVEPALSDLPNYTELTNLYDQYCIKGVELKIIPKHTQSSQTFQVDSGSSPGMITVNTEGTIHTVLDYNQLGAGFGINDLVQYQNHRMGRTNKIHKRYFKPSTLTSTYNGGVTSAYAVQKDKWISCANAGVPHYGLYGAIDLQSTSPGAVS